MGAERNFALIAFSGLLLTSCASAMIHKEMEQDRKDAQDTSAPYIGHQYWPVGNSLTVYERPATLSKNVIATGRFRLDSLDECYGKQCFFHVTFDSGISGFILIDPHSFARTFQDHPWQKPHPPAIYPSFLDRLKPKDADERRQLSGVWLGMSPAEVLASAWGPPVRKEETHTAKYDREYWYYADGNELEFQGGKLAGIKK